MIPEVKFRPFSGNGIRSASDSYATLAQLYRRIWPQRATEPARLRASDRRRQAMGPLVRHLFEVEGQVIGVGEAHRSPYYAEPGHFVVQVGMLPAWRQRGAYARLTQALDAAVAPFLPTRLVTYADGDDQMNLALAKSQGYVEFQRETEFTVTLAGFDISPHLPRLNKPTGHGIEIVPVQALASDPQRDLRIWELDSELFQQIPGEQGSRPGFEQWHRQVIGRDDFLADGSFIARDRQTGEYVGLTLLFNEAVAGRALIELTGVRGTHRRMGLATALKLRSMLWAQANGLKQLRTYNDATNEPIRRLNESLGFVAGTDAVSLHRQVGAAAVTPPTTVAANRLPVVA